MKIISSQQILVVSGGNSVDFNAYLPSKAQCYAYMGALVGFVVGAHAGKLYDSAQLGASVGVIIGGVVGYSYATPIYYTNSFLTEL